MERGGGGPILTYIKLNSLFYIRDLGQKSMMIDLGSVGQSSRGLMTNVKARTVRVYSMVEN